MTIRMPFWSLSLTVMFIAHVSVPAQAADNPIKAFICAGQSNMVGWGDSTKLPDDLRKGNDRVRMCEDSKWQPLRPHAPANQGQRRVGLTEFYFGPEIAFGHEMAKAWPDETIGIIKFSIGGTSVLAWKPDWSKEDADRVGQGRHGSLYKKLMQKVYAASGSGHTSPKPCLASAYSYPRSVDRRIIVRDQHRDILSPVHPNAVWLS